MSEETRIANTEDQDFFTKLDRLDEIQIAALAHRDLVFAGQKQKLFRAFEFVEIADILAVDPDAGCIGAGLLALEAKSGR